MTTRALFLLACLAWPAPSAAQSPPDPPFVIATAALITVASADLAISTYAFGAGVAAEGGIGRGLEQHPVAFGLVKGSFIAADVAVFGALHRRHPRLAFWMTVGVTSLEAAVTWRNARLLRRLR